MAEPDGEAAPELYGAGVVPLLTGYGTMVAEVVTGAAGVDALVVHTDV